ncbi:hypothetical protein CPB83DRAFT_846515 [Crepidotus variabilis]|uniref:Uncharacterized protein n=1 Tax=Crepidotus variabilis TaxID=179855 RepID=A0A9P6EQ14_9AGAR|nr:hypothetical protein CPB83DRAFT_846515 [Crepidotus variabilis]
MCKKNFTAFSIPHLDICMTKKIETASCIIKCVYEKGEFKDLVFVPVEQRPTTFQVSSLSINDLRLPSTARIRYLFDEISNQFHDELDEVVDFDDDTSPACSMGQENQDKTMCSSSDTTTEAASDDVFEEKERELFEQTSSHHGQGEIRLFHQSEDKKNILPEDCGGSEEEREVAPFIGEEIICNEGQSSSRGRTESS